MVSLVNGCEASLLVVLVLLSIFTVGEMSLKLAKHTTTSFLHGVVLRYWIGTILYSCLWFLIGSFHLLNSVTFWVVTSMFCIFAWRNGVVVTLFQDLKERLRNQEVNPLKIVTGFATTILLVVLFFSCFRYMPFLDEGQYLWSSPMYWASQGTWSASPYRHSDGPILWSVIYTVFAISDSNAGAHLFTLSSLPVAAASVALIGRRLGLPKYLSALMVFGTPQFINASYSCGTDLPAASLALFLIHIGVETKFASEPRALDKVSLLAIWSLYSIKLTIVPSFFIFSLLTLNNSVSRFSDNGKFVIGKLFALRIYLLPIFVSFAMWTLRNFVLTGKMFDQRNETIATGPNHWLWHTGAELARIPDLKEALVIPILPLLLPFLGGQEPYGGRIGFAMLLLWPTIFAATRLNLKGMLFSITQNLPAFLLVSSWVTYSLVSILVPKTRYSAYVWPLMCISCISILSDRLLPKYRSKLMLLSAGLCLVSIILDEMRVLVAGLIGEYLR